MNGEDRQVSLPAAISAQGFDRWWLQHPAYHLAPMGQCGQN
jgi:hypothetical protein